MQGRYFGLEKYTELSLSYHVSKHDVEKLKQLLINREKKKMLCRFLYNKTLRERVKALMTIDSIYQDSVFALLIPHNKYMSGSNIKLAMKLSMSLDMFRMQKDTITWKAVSIARKLKKNPKLDVWDDEMNFLTEIFSDKQLEKFFIHKNGAKITKKLNHAWNMLYEKDLVAEVDSSKEWPKAYLYYHREQKIHDLYKNHTDLRRKNLSELRKHKPKLIKMYEAYLKREKINIQKEKEETRNLAW